MPFAGSQHYTLSTQKNFLGENNIEKRADADDVHAISRLGSLYLHGANGYPRNADKALEIWLTLQRHLQLQYLGSFLAI